MEKKYEFQFTRHLRERYLQRAYKKFAPLEYLSPHHPEHKELIQDMLYELRTKGQEYDREMLQRLRNAKEVRSHLNNSEFMAHYYDKYGTDKRFQFLVDDDILFVIVIDDGQKVVVTCVRSKDHIAGRIANRPKFKKKEQEFPEFEGDYQLKKSG